MHDLLTKEVARSSNMHMHMRIGDLMRAIAYISSRHFKNILVMPNVKFDNGLYIVNGQMAWDYKEMLEPLLHPDVKVWSTQYLVPSMTRQDILDAWEMFEGLISWKFYPANATTNSEDGFASLKAAYRQLEVIAEIGGLVNIHAEVSPPPGLKGPALEAHYATAEQRFLPQPAALESDIPELRFIIEHLSSAEGVEYVLGSRDGVFAGVTTQHLIGTNADLHNRHSCCLPRFKTEKDRSALRGLVTSMNPKVSWGDDSAPHWIQQKLRELANGVFPGPDSWAMVVQVFEEVLGPDNWVEPLEHFTAYSFHNAYPELDVPAEGDTVTLVKRPHQVDEEIGGVVPFMAGQTLQWEIVDEARAA